MTLSDYKTSNGLSLTALAAQLGKPVSTVSDWLSKRRFPNREALADIFARTGGAVTAADMRPDWARLVNEAA